MATRSNSKHLVNLVLVTGVFIIFVLACFPPSKGFRMVQSGCITPDGSKIALTDIEEFSRLQTRHSIDKYRLILDGKNGKVIWTDLSSSDPLACAEDNSIISISESGAKWVETDKEIVFTQKGDGLRTSFIGMTDRNTIVREDRPYYLKEMSGSGGRKSTSSLRSFSSFPALLIDRLGENGTRTITFTESDLDSIGKNAFFNYEFEKDRIIINAGQKLYATDPVNGKTQVIRENYADLQRSWESDDRYDAVETGRVTPEGVVEIYEGKGDRARLVRQINKSELGAKVISIIDCCNNGLILLYWENGNYLKVAKIDHLSGAVIWKSDSLLSTDQK